MKRADIGMIGLAVMGENLSLNMHSKGYCVAVFNYETQVVDTFMSGRGKDKDFIGTYSYKQLAESLKKPRKIMMMVKAGDVVDQVIEELLPHLDAGDIIIDGGNSNFHDTIRRTKFLEDKGYYFIGCGVSGGEEGALRGPSLMPGGSEKAWEQVKDILFTISAKADDGSPCCDWIGSDGAGHFVKMVHNGIEYGDMQLICEAYLLMRDVLDMSADEIQEVFSEWKDSELKSYLIEITANIFGYKDIDRSPLIDKILDTAGQKGTGKWTAITALDDGVPLTLIGEAVYARCLTAVKDERVIASKEYKKEDFKFKGDKKMFIEDIRKALYASKIISYAQGFSLMRVAADSYDWDLDYGEIAMMWRSGCIIRSAFLDKIKDAYQNNPEIMNIVLDSYFKTAIHNCIEAWRNVACTSVKYGVPVPAICSAINYFDGYTSEFLPANLLQAQRDYFGAHSYERIDKARGKFFHTNWTGFGGKTASTSYEV